MNNNIVKVGLFRQFLHESYPKPNRLNTLKVGLMERDGMNNKFYYSNLDDSTNERLRKKEGCKHIHTHQCWLEQKNNKGHHRTRTNFNTM